MSYAEIVKIREALKQHFNCSNRFLLVKCVTNNTLKELLPSGQLKHHIDFISPFIHLDKLYNILMASAAKNGLLTTEINSTKNTVKLEALARTIRDPLD